MDFPDILPANSEEFHIIYAYTYKHISTYINAGLLV
jgi:hypothetical protein